MRTFFILALLISWLLGAVQPLGAAAIGGQAPAFSLRSLDGQMVDSAAIIGSKPLLLVFWASWCPACREEIPRINTLFEELGAKGMAFLGINVGVNDSEDRARRFARKYQMRYPVAFDEGSRVTSAFQVIGTPTVIIVDRKGIIRYQGHQVPEKLAGYFSELNQ